MAIANGQQEKEGISQDNQLAAMAVVLVTFQQGHNSDFNSLSLKNEEQSTGWQQQPKQQRHRQ